MKIRIMGTKDECEQVARFFLSQRGKDNVSSVEVSSLYPNRAPSNLFRLYVEVTLKNCLNRLEGGAE